MQEIAEKYSRIFSLAEENYAEPVNGKAAVDGSIARMLRRLDPHSNFYDAEPFRQFQDFQRGSTSGIGLEVGVAEGKALVLFSVPGSAAYELGIRPGDTLKTVDGEEVKDWSSSRIEHRFEGLVGTEGG